jgi:hypothetical protein
MATPSSLPDAEALAAMEEPLHRLASAAMLLSDVIEESTEGPDLRIRSLLAEMMCRDATRLFRLYHGHPPRICNNSGDFPSLSP